jgi:GNAT superfamily N-acetyltransferase
MSKEFRTEAINQNERAVFEIWHDRFVNEYNRSQQARQGHILNLGTPQWLWNQSFENNVGPLWIKCGNRNIGFVSPQAVTLGLNKETAQQIQIVSDVYIDPKFRGRGLLAACLMEQRENGRCAILIDEQKLTDNADYYASLGFRFAMRWPEEELLIVSPTKLIDDNMWIEIIPEELAVAE